MCIDTGREIVLPEKGLLQLGGSSNKEKPLLFEEPRRGAARQNKVLYDKEKKIGPPLFCSRI